MEIERKWRFRGGLPPEVVMPERGTKLVQGYVFAGPQGALRIRNGIVDGRAVGPAVLTIKGSGTLAREEFEVEIPPWAAEVLWAQADCSLQKIRFHVADPAFYRFLEVDVFLGHLAGLVLIEMEFATEKEAASYTLPAWAAGAEEVTEDPRYTNAGLAKLEGGLASLDSPPCT